MELHVEVYMIQIKKPNEMTEEEIFAEVSDLLAMGVCRLKSRAGYLEAMKDADEDHPNVHDGPFEQQN